MSVPQAQDLQVQVDSLSQKLQEATQQLQTSGEHAHAMESELQHEQQEREVACEQLLALQADVLPQVRCRYTSCQPAADVQRLAGLHV